MAYVSRDDGARWDYVGTVADAKVYSDVSMEGPNEHDIVRLPNGTSKKQNKYICNIFTSECALEDTDGVLPDPTPTPLTSARAPPSVSTREVSYATFSLS